MNERIKELLEQSLRWSGENVNRNLYSVYEIQQKEYEKFAELIVRECSRIADGWVDNDDNGKNYPSEMIKQHFGVEL